MVRQNNTMAEAGIAVTRHSGRVGTTLPYSFEPPFKKEADSGDTQQVGIVIEPRTATEAESPRIKGADTGENRQERD